MASIEKIPLEIGSFGKLLIREEEIYLFPKKPWPYRILYVSDIHLSQGNAERLTQQLVEAADEALPHLILFGGDLIDNVRALPALSECVRSLSAIAPLASVGGNHDISVGIKGVEKAVIRGGGLWLGNESFSFQWGEKKVRVDGRIKHKNNGQEKKILCTHFPDLFPKAAQRGYELVLAGHLHGCQCVFWQKKEKLYPGAWFYQWNGLRFQDGPCSLLVSRGVSDSFPIRWNCPREVLLCKIY